MNRVTLALVILAGVLTTLGAPALAQPVAPVPIDQAGWTERKRHVTLRNGLRMAYVELGDPAGEPVLLLHGFTDSSRVWTILAPWLVGHRLIVPDQRGHGGSDAPACCYAMSDFAEDARQLLDALAIERTAVVGHSMGSMAGQLLAAEHPERVSRLVLIGSTALAPVRRDDWMWSNVMALREPVAANADFLVQWSPGASPTPVDPVFVRHADAEMVRVPLRVWRAVPRALLDVPVARHAADVRAPVLILSGGRDPLFGPEHHRSLVAAYPGARAQVFAELGHNLIVERPHEIGPVLAAFLAMP
jgi:pimeloyl-ACP methyl ester carboxylesterase